MRRVRSSLAVIGLLAVLGCSSANVRVNRDWDDAGEEIDAWEAQSPDAFVDRLGQPDEWTYEGEDPDLRMTAIWKCVDGRDRLVTWRRQDSDKGVLRWAVVSDISREAACD